MRRLLPIIFGLIVSLFLSNTVFAVENWDVRGTYTVSFTCTSGCVGTYNHSMNITVEDMDSGEFSGTGYYITNPSYSWNVSGDIDGDNINFYIDYTGLNPSYYVNASGTIAANGNISGSASAPGQTFNWSTTSGLAKFNRRAEITSPAPDSIVTDTLNLNAYLMDNDFDPVQWAVRKGTCAAATGTVIGNVDGYSDAYNWGVDSGDPYKYNFSASINVTNWDEGVYCFIFNPVEDSGESNIREIQFFIVDLDGDGVYDNDYCTNTQSDEITEQHGVNRWILTDNNWMTVAPKGKVPQANYSIQQTKGCSCFQILDWLHEYDSVLYGTMEGHRKFGCSKSVIEDFIRLSSL